MPKKPDEPRAATQMVGFQLRFQEQTRAKLESAAKANGASLNSEVVARLERSLQDDARAGSHNTSRFLITMASQIAVAESDTGKSWQEDAETYWLARLLMLRTIAAHDPVSRENKAYVELKAKKEAAQERRDLLDKVLTECRAIGRNALLMLATSKEGTDYTELDEKFWINPTAPDEAMSDEDRTTVRNWLVELKELREQIASLHLEIVALRVPISVAKERALASFERLTAPVEV